MADLLALTADLVGIPSESHDEGAITEFLGSSSTRRPWLTVDQVGNNLVARTQLGRPLRLILAGHTDTVPINGNGQPRVEGDTLWGCGASDMKSGLAVMLELARTVSEPAVDVTYVFYEAEEVDAIHNGLRRLFAERPTSSPATSRSSVSRRRRDRSGLPRHDAGRDRPRRRARAHRAALDGPQRDPPARPRARPARPRMSSVDRSSTAASTARRCKRCSSRAASRATSCPTVFVSA